MIYDGGPMEAYKAWQECRKYNSRYRRSYIRADEREDRVYDINGQEVRIRVRTYGPRWHKWVLEGITTDALRREAYALVALILHWDIKSKDVPPEWVADAHALLGPATDWEPDAASVLAGGPYHWYVRVPSHGWTHGQLTITPDETYILPTVRIMDRAPLKPQRPITNAAWYHLPGEPCEIAYSKTLATYVVIPEYRRTRT